MKLKSILKTLSVSELQGIRKTWGIPAPPESPTKGRRDSEEEQEFLVNYLYQRLQSRPLWENVFADLTDDQKSLVHFLAIHGGDMDREELTARFAKGDGKRLDKMVAALSKKGVVLYDEVPGLRSKLVLAGVPEPFLRYIELPSFWEGYLGYFLKEKSSNELKHIATQGLRVEVECANKNYLIWLIRKHLLDPAFLRRYQSKLPAGPRGVLEMVLDRKGVCVYRDLLELNVQKRYDHSRGDSIQWLLNTSGLLYTAALGGNKYNNLLMVPRDVYYVISNHYKPDNRSFGELDFVSVVRKEEAPSVVLDNSVTFMRDLVGFCSFVDRHPMRVLATGGIGKNDLKKVLPILSRHKSPKYAEFLSLIAIQKRFLVSTGDHYRVSHHFLEWLEDPANGYAEIVGWWLKSTEWNEEFVDGNTVHVDPAPSGLTSIVSFRRTTLEALNEMPRDRWLVFDGFLEEAIPLVEQEIPGRGAPLSYDKHTRANHLVIESIVAEALYWLGVLAIGVRNEKDAEIIGTRIGDGKTIKPPRGQRGRPRKQPHVDFTFRFTDLGRFVFENHPEHWPEMCRRPEHGGVFPLRFDSESFIVQPNHEIMVPPDLKLRTFFALTEFGSIRSIDIMSILAVSKESLQGGLDRGLRAEDILDFLQTHSQTPVPDSLTHLVKECSGKHGEVNMGYAGGFIHIEDPAMLQQVKSNKRTAPFVKRTFDGGLVVLQPDTDLRRMGRELQRIGFMPRLESEHVRTGDQETFHLTLSKEDFYTLIACVRFAMETRDARGVPVAEERLSPLLERLKTDPRTFGSLNNLADPLLKTWKKALNQSMERQLDEVKSRYQSQLTQIVSSTVPRGLSKHNFSGPNPATDEDDIEQMLDFAVENEFEVEIEYVKNNRQQVSEIVFPEGVERDRLLGRCRSRDNAFAVYKIDRVTKAKLL